MKRYWTVIGLMLLFLLSTFFVFEKLSFSFLSNPTDSMNASSGGAALAGISLLVADVILPVPSSLVMIANGALFGITLGMSLSLVGNLAAALAGFFIGRRSEPMVARFVPAEERSRANHLLNEWGLLAIIITRPIPLLAEATVVMAGASSMGWKLMIVGVLAGSFPVSLLYALVGATGAQLDNAFLTFGLVLLIAGLFWFVGLYWRRFISSNRPYA